METEADCRQTDIVCIADELLDRWHALPGDTPPEEEPLDTAPECLPCLLEDPAFAD